MSGSPPTPLRGTDLPPRFPRLGVAEIFAPLPSLRALIPGLGIYVAAPTLIASQAEADFALSRARDKVYYTTTTAPMPGLYAVATP